MHNSTQYIYMHTHTKNEFVKISSQCVLKNGLEYLVINFVDDVVLALYD